MREILFRGKARHNGEWVEGGLVIPTSKKSWVEESVIVNKSLYVIDTATVGQYTGLTDKNGKRIFEGDIIQMHDNPNDLAVIQFGEFSCVDIGMEEKIDRVMGWHYKPLKTDAISQLEPFCWEFQLNELWVKESGMEVIGNIHDNLEWMAEVRNDRK